VALYVALHEHDIPLFEIGPGVCDHSVLVDRQTPGILGTVFRYDLTHALHYLPHLVDAVIVCDFRCGRERLQNIGLNTVVFDVLIVLAQVFGVREFGLVQLRAQSKVGGVELGDGRHYAGTSGAGRRVRHVSGERVDDVDLLVPPAPDSRVALSFFDKVLVAFLHRLDQAEYGVLHLVLHETVHVHVRLRVQRVHRPRGTELFQLFGHLGGVHAAAAQEHIAFGLYAGHADFGPQVFGGVQQLSDVPGDARHTRVGDGVGLQLFGRHHNRIPIGVAGHR